MTATSAASSLLFWTTAGFSLMTVLPSADQSQGPRATRILCFGDSITYGYSASDVEKTSYPALLQTLLDKKFGKGLSRVTNAGASGEDTRRARARIGGLLEKCDPDFVLVLYGTNDLWTPRGITPEETRKNLAAVIATIGAGGARAIVGTLIPVRNDDEKVAERNEVIRTVAADAAVRLADLNQAFEKALEKEGGRGKTQAWEKFYANEEEGAFVHPNDAGNALVAGKWFETLQEELGGR